MLIDHAGILLFPGAAWMRIVGRLAFPLYAFCIAEGFRHTRSRGKYFLRIFILGAACQIVYYVAAGDTLIGILIAFSLSILYMWLFDETKTALRERKKSRYALLTACVAALAALWLLCQFVEIDYGFFGVILPVLISLFEDRRARLCAMAMGLIVLCVDTASVRQWFCLAALIPAALYNGQPGRHRLKYFFYIFYPAHLALLQLIAWVV